MGLPLSQEKRSRWSLTPSLCLSHSHQSQCPHLLPHHACIGQTRMHWIKKHSPCFVFTLDSNSYLTPSRARDLAPSVLSSIFSDQHLLSACLIRFPNKVNRHSEYLHILMGNSPASFQTFYLWLPINIPNQHSFHWKVWNSISPFVLPVHGASWSPCLCEEAD